MTKLKILTLLVLVIMIVGCQAQVDLSQPPEILYGEDVCTECGMIISEPRFAAAYYTLEGDARRFDDIGGMLTHHAANQEEVAQFWVHDYETEEWIVADQAYFVSSAELHTPMGFGVVAFSDQARAQQFADKSNTMVMSFAAIMESYIDADASHEHSDS